jgi:hypothetical protein
MESDGGESLGHECEHGIAASVAALASAESVEEPVALRDHYVGPVRRRWRRIGNARSNKEFINHLVA